MVWITLGGLGLALLLLVVVVRDVAHHSTGRALPDVCDGDLEPLTGIALVARARLRHLTAWEIRDSTADGLVDLEAGCPGNTSPSGQQAVTEAVATSTAAAQAIAQPPSRTPLTVRVLGCPAVFDTAGNRVTGLREAAVELLVYLAVHRAGADIERIKADVYGDVDPRRAAERLSTDLANLRQRIRHALSAGRATNPVVKVGGRYRLAPGVVRVDWWKVQDACRQAQAAGPRTVEQEAALETASASFVAPLADGAAYGWIAAPQEHSRRLAIAVHTRLAEMVASRDQERAALLLERAATFDPFDEELAVRVIKAHRLVGDRDAAVRRFEQLREALEELGETPDPATFAVVRSCVT